MSYSKKKAILDALSCFVKDNLKVILCATALFAAGIIIGIITAYHAVGGEFEIVIRSEIETGSFKVFAIAVAALAGCYAVILVGGINKKTAILMCIPLALTGYFFGRYSVALVGRFESYGIVNLLLVYAPFFLASFACMTVACCVNLAPYCPQCEGRLKPSFVKTLKIFGINAAVAFVFLLIIGAIIGGTIIVTLF